MRRITKPGITILEVVIYLALFAMFFVTTLQFAFTIIEANTNARFRIETQRNSIFIIQHLSQSFAKLETFDAASSIFDSQYSKLRIITDQGAMIYRVDNKQLNLIIDGQVVPLHNRLTEISKFEAIGVYNVDNQLIGIDISLELNAINREFIKYNFATYYSLE